MTVEITTIKKCVCDRCGKEIDKEKESEKLYWIVGPYGDQFASCGIKFDNYVEPYAKHVVDPDFCRECKKFIFEKALSKLR